MAARRGVSVIGTISALLVCLSATGCVQRRLTIVSDPPGALVKIDDYEIGTTPVSTSFTFYGVRQVKLIKDGYETKTLMQPIPAPWYQYPVLDFFSDNFAMHEIRDSRVLHYKLEPMMISSTDEIVKRGENLRSYGQAPPAYGPAGPPPPNMEMGPGEMGPGFPFQPGPTLPAPNPGVQPPYAPGPPYAPAPPLAPGPPFTPGQQTIPAPPTTITVPGPAFGPPPPLGQ